MKELAYYLVDVFTATKYGGNQLAVFIDYDNLATDEDMLQIARELGFAEITFIKKNNDNERFDVRIFTPEYEVPFAGHPSLGTAYVISKHLIPSPKEKLTLSLKHADIDIILSDLQNIDRSFFTMTQANLEFVSSYSYEDISEQLGIDYSFFNTSLPIEEITTGLPYIIIPIKNIDSINRISLEAKSVINFLIQHEKHKSNSVTGLSTSFFFFTEETVDQSNDYHTRMLLIENGQYIEDAATGSANGCFLAYLLKNINSAIDVTTEQGFQMNRPSYLKLDGKLNNGNYTIKVGGQVVSVGSGKWNI
ncbi:trans-2,3-dihydro-3-hydroxyanthranilate isomerase [Tenacibaculum sp. MAR_2009_124]|uniref:PhzF family phenazine biosynthesis protein n=1 Tax=Tenacibaculum sp. MAR_2009_124 TaxID=1250059 RepID=UPI000899CBAD|nr:PhzF family phenazine biosynthesis protein [Tenacibaculum sp. MAR_2009_124]SEC77444.1 trans-2,3-dihydro-3-hydroxyanthranilate isomerase [Tenacibaculum sp. MAR_2009_124]